MKDRIALPSVVGIAAALLYLARPSAFYNFDGVACAVAVELSDFKHLAHGNHVLYGLVGWLFDQLWRAAGYAGLSIIPLQTLDSLLGALGAGVFCRLLLDLGFSRGRALACSAGLALSQAYWFWSLEAQVYPLGNVFALLAFRAALSDERPGAFSGFWLGLAMLGHVGHMMMFPALLPALCAARRPKEEIILCVRGVAGMLAGGYLLGALAVWPTSWAMLKSWLLGSAALTLDGSVRWYGGHSSANLVEWLRMTPRIFAEPEGLSGAPRSAAWILGLCGAGAAAWGARAVFNHGRRLAAACAVVWIFSYALLFASWQPFTPVYRISDLFALWLLVAFAAPVAATTALAAALGGFNLIHTILPRTDPANNAPLTETQWVKENTPEDAWIVVTGLGQVYTPYFGQRRPLNTKYYEGRPEKFAERLAAEKAVYVTSATLEQANGADWADALRRYGLRKVAEGPVSLFKAERTGSPKAKAGKG